MLSGPCGWRHNIGQAVNESKDHFLDKQKRFHRTMPLHPFFDLFLSRFAFQMDTEHCLWKGMIEISLCFPVVVNFEACTTGLLIIWVIAPAGFWRRVLAQRPKPEEALQKPTRNCPRRVLAQRPKPEEALYKSPRNRENVWYNQWEKNSNRRSIASNRKIRSHLDLSDTNQT